MNPAAIVPFAQTEMVDTFFQGVDPQYQKAVDEVVQAGLETFAQTVSSIVAAATGNRDIQAIDAMLGAANSKLMTEFRTQLKAIRDQKFVKPIVDQVVVLPKTELASMAEYLVNLTAMKRHVASPMETVGGPVDVALLSKGDGFVWVKRKHYFDKDLNYHFFKNYFRKTDEEAPDEQPRTDGI